MQRHHDHRRPHAQMLGLGGDVGGELQGPRQIAVSREMMLCQPHNIRQASTEHSSSPSMSCLLCGELPESYFGRLCVQGVPLDKHLLVPEFGLDPHLLKFDRSTYDIFRTKRC